MPSEHDIRRWLAVAQQQRGDVRARLVQLMSEEMDDDANAVRLADLVMARLPPAERVPVRPPAPDRATSGRPAAEPDLPKTSPYRFVELNRIVIPAPAAVREAHLDLPLSGGYSGTIEVDWVAETPLLIGMQEGGEAQQEVVPLRLGAQGDYAIPGATLKGLLRSGVEILTLGRLSQINGDHRFGLRDFSDEYYSKDSDGTSRLAWDKIGAGWLERRAATAEEHAQGLSDYCITPCDKRTVRIRALPPSWFGGTMSDGARHLDWLKRTLKDKYRPAGIYDGTRFDFSAATHSFGVAPTGDAVPVASGAGTPGIYVFSGPLPLPRDFQSSELDAEERSPAAGDKKKREYVFLERAGAEPTRLTQLAFDTFELINSTPSGRGLQPTGSWQHLRPTLCAGGRIPVFILGDLKAERFDFGLTRTFKVAHAHSVADVLYAQTGRAHRLSAGMLPDWAEALFGHVFAEDDLLGPRQHPPRTAALPPGVLARKGRVAVGFARAAPASAALFPPAARAALSTTMMGPRASFGPHYLVGPFKHWSHPEAGLAGRKRYFPRFAGGDPAAAQSMVVSDRTLPPSGSDRTASRLRFLVPVAGQAGVGFTGQIRLHNVLAEEVGAILWVLTHGGRIGGPYRHMLGRAKAFGAGQTTVAAVRLALSGHDAIADRRLDPTAPLQPFLAAFEAAMDQAVRAVGLSGRWAEQTQVTEWLGLSDPAWGQAERQSEHARYPGAAPAMRDGQPGMDMTQGPAAHMRLRRDVGNRNLGNPRWLATPGAVSRVR